MTDLPSFSGDDVRCPKCGNEGASTTWIAPGFVSPEGVPGECLKRECRRCDYLWAEATVEQKPTVREGA